MVYRREGRERSPRRGGNNLRDQRDRNNQRNNWRNNGGRDWRNDNNRNGWGRAGQQEQGKFKPQLDRNRICPFLLRIFHKMGEHHSLEDFQPGKEPEGSELQVYTWSDVTLRELADLVKDVASDALAPEARLSFRLIYPGKDGKNVMTDVGEVLSITKGESDNKLLSDSNFQVGDCLSLAIL
eukprot:GEMP01049375.1.p1 GENE.GEMP01049375.1~~GEMP01049375.1.p1  ORF type:complete len:182 (+),score=41.15 GEMP01049375.1:57-602(+)